MENPQDDDFVMSNPVRDNVTGFWNNELTHSNHSSWPSDSGMGDQQRNGVEDALHNLAGSKGIIRSNERCFIIEILRCSA